MGGGCSVSDTKRKGHTHHFVGETKKIEVISYEFDYEVTLNCSLGVCYIWRFAL